MGAYLLVLRLQSGSATQLMGQSSMNESNMQKVQDGENRLELSHFFYTCSLVFVAIVYPCEDTGAVIVRLLASYMAEIGMRSFTSCYMQNFYLGTCSVG